MAKIARRSGQGRPLALTITLPFLALILLQSLIVAVVGDGTVESALDLEIDRYARGAKANLQLYLGELLSEPIEFAEANAERLATGRIRPDRPDATAQPLVPQIRYNPFVTLIAVASRDGSHVAASRSPVDGSLSLFTSGPAPDCRLREFAMGPDDLPGPEKASPLPFKLAERVWFKAAQASPGPVWTPVYRFITDDSLGIGFVVPLRDRTGRLIAASSCSVALSRLSEYLRAILPDSAPFAFITDAEGFIVATSSAAPLWIDGAEGDFRRLRPTESGDPYLKAMSAGLSAQGGSPRSFDFVFAGRRHSFRAEALEFPRGLRLDLGMAIDETSYKAEFSGIRALNLALALGLGILAVLIGLIIGGKTVEPIRALRDRAHLLAAGDWSAPPSGRTGARELADLSQSFETMAASLRSTLDGLESKVAERTAEIQTLLRETHHRLKNNLGVAASLLSYQAALSASPETTDALEDASRRIKSMAILYDRIYRSADLSFVDAASYLGSLVANLKDSLVGPRSIEVRTDLEPLELDAKRASSLGIIVTELFTNACKYAFPQEAKGTVIVRSRLGEGFYAVTVEDDGAGLPPGFELSKAGFGLTLAAELAVDLGGGLAILPRDRGTAFELRMKAGQGTG